MRLVPAALIIALGFLPSPADTTPQDTLSIEVPASTLLDSTTVALRSIEGFRNHFLAAAMNGDRTALATVEADRNRAHGVLARALNIPEVLTSLLWPERRMLLAVALHEHQIAWSRILFDTYHGELDNLDGPGRGPSAFILGLTAERLHAVAPTSSALAESLAAFSRAAYGISVEEDFLLSDEAIYRLWLLAGAQGDLSQASALADSLAGHYPRSIRTPKVRLTRARTLHANGEPSKAIEEARLALPDEDSAELRWVLVQATLDLGFTKQAARNLEHLIGAFGSHQLAVTALKKRETLGEEDAALTLDTKNWIRLATHLLPNPDSETTDTLMAMSGDKSLAPEHREAAGLALARYFYRSKQYTRAEPILKDLRFSTDRATLEETHLILARIYRNTGRRGPMKAHYRRVIKEAGAEASRAFWELGRELESLARWSEAEAVYTEFLDHFQVTPRYRDVVFRRGFCRIRRGRSSLAVNDFREAFRLSKSGAEEEQAAFWLARTLRALGEDEQALVAAKAGAATPEPVDGYGVLLRQEFLPTSRQIEFAEPHHYDEGGLLSQLDATEWPGRVQHHFQRGLQFAELGEVDAARMEWRRAHSLGGKLPSLVQSLALVAAAFDVYPEGVRWAKRAGDSLALEHPLQIGFKRLSYPPAFYGDVFHNSVKNKLDPAAIWALMRQESLYDRLAVSRVGALGLMQIMPYTLDRINQAAGKPLQPPEVLFQPEVNLNLGIAFFSDRMKEFDHNLLPTLASYNAGESKSWEWLGRAGGDTREVFIECIGYPETYNYARRILWLNWVYSTYYRPASEVRGELR